jgi:tetratricopeptide (TPR) repeat protein
MSRSVWVKKPWHWPAAWALMNWSSNACAILAPHSPAKGIGSGLAMEKESLELALALNRPHDAGRGYLYYGEGLLYLGDYEQARDIFEQAIAYTRQMNVPYITDAAVRMLAEVEWLTGDWSSALARLNL